MRTIFARYVSLFSLFVCVAITAYGAYSLEPSFSLGSIVHYLRTVSVVSYASFICTFFIAIAIFSKLLHLHPYAAGCLIGILIIVISNMIWPLLCALLFFMSSYICGKKILSAFKIPCKFFPLIVPILSGTVLYGMIASILFHFPINYAGLYFVLCIIPAVFEYKHIEVLLRSVIQQINSVSPTFWLDTSVVTMLLLLFSITLMPDLGSDSHLYHLAFPSYIKMHQQWHFDSLSYFFACWPMLAPSIFSIGYLLAGEFGTKLILFGFFLSIPVLLIALTAWMEHAPTKTTKNLIWLAVMSLPDFLFYVGNVLQDVIWISYSLVGILIIFNIVSSKKQTLVLQRASLILGGFFVGAMLATKVHSFATLIPLLVLLFCCMRKWVFCKNFGAIFLGLLCCLVIGGIPYFVSWFKTGNPVYPYFAQFFGTPFNVPPGGASWNETLGWDVLYQMTFSAEKYGPGYFGMSGFFWILFCVPVTLRAFSLASFRKISAVVLILGIVVGTFCFIFPQVRYLEVANLLLISSVCALFRDRCFTIGKWNVVFFAFTIAILCNFFCYRTYGMTPDVSLSVLADKENSRFESSVSYNGQDVIPVLNSLNSARLHVLMMHPLVNFYGLAAPSFDPRFLQEIATEKGYDFQKSVGWESFLRDYGVGYVLFYRSSPYSLPMALEVVTKTLIVVGNVEIRVPLMNRPLIPETVLHGSKSWYVETNNPFSRRPFSEFSGDVIIGSDGVVAALFSFSDVLKRGRYRLTISALNGTTGLQSTAIARIMGFSVKTGNWRFLGNCWLKCDDNEREQSIDIAVPEDVTRVELHLLAGNPREQVIYKTASFFGI